MKIYFVNKSVKFKILIGYQKWFSLYEVLLKIYDLSNKMWRKYESDTFSKKHLLNKGYL